MEDHTGVLMHARSRQAKPVGTVAARASTIWALVVVVVLSACGSASPPSGEGLVTGGIVPCAAIVPPNGEQYAAGTVMVLKGYVSWRATGPGTSVVVFPKIVAAQETVATNASYQFGLAPGKYVLQAHFPAPANAIPFISITVKVGTAEHVDIPNVCI
jgi:uncharacterized membrane protein